MIFKVELYFLKNKHPKIHLNVANQSMRIYSIMLTGDYGGIHFFFNFDLKVNNYIDCEYLLYIEPPPQ